MKRKNMLLMAGLVVFTLVSHNAFALEDAWTDYDPCGWNVEEETVAGELAWTDYDPCGWNVEQEAPEAELAWTDYDPCGWNVEQETVEAEVAKAFVPANALNI